MEIKRIRGPTRSNLDDRTRLMLQDALQNSILNSTSVAPSGTRRMSLSTCVAAASFAEPVRYLRLPTSTSSRAST
jgi:hypothetical protein